MAPRSGVCVQREYCPLCFRRGVPVQVAKDSPTVDAEQAECSSSFRTGLPLLDLASPGSPCPTPCRLACLVCGSVAVFGCEPEFQEVLDALEDYESEALELETEVLHGGLGFSFLGEEMVQDLERRIRRRLRELGLGWHPRWKRPTHLHCLKKAECDCVLPVCASRCRAHGEFRPLLSKRARPPETMESEKKSLPELQLGNNRTVGPPLATSKATWLSKPTALASTASQFTIPAQTVSAPSKRRPPPIAKPNLRLQAAASGCGKLDQWAGNRVAGFTASDSACIRPFHMGKHHGEFDPFKHGYWRVNGRDVYRFPDGREVPVQSPVNRLTDQGELAPS